MWTPRIWTGREGGLLGSGGSGKGEEGDREREREEWDGGEIGPSAAIRSVFIGTVSFAGVNN